MMRGGKSRSVVCAIVIATLWGSIWDSPAGATITAIGDIVPLYDDSDPWSVSGDLIIGAVADANLVISGGSQVTDDRGFIGLSSNEFVVPEVTVTGAGSLWQNGSNLVIGSVGRGALIIENGGRVTSPSSSVASGPNSGGMVRVTGSGSLWDSDLFRVGEAGIGTVYIEEGGRVTSHTAVLGGGATAAGMVLVSDANSTWENLADPNTGLGGDLSVNYYLGVGNGGHVVSGTGLVNGEVVVDGEGSLWENQTSIQLGLPGTGSLSITNGGTVTTSNAIVGSDPNGEGAIVVDGSGSTLEVEQELDVGLYGNASMSVSDGGRVSAMISMMGAEAGSTAAVTVAGTDSSWSGWGATFVGVRGTASLTVSDGAMVYDPKAGRAIEKRTVPMETARGICELAEKMGIYVQAYPGEGYFAAARTKYTGLYEDSVKV
jgi:T5SS/PEP-CTERM-associated repeat protein